MAGMTLPKITIAVNISKGTGNHVRESNLKMAFRLMPLRECHLENQAILAMAFIPSP